LLPSHFIAQTGSAITLYAKVLDGNGAPVRNVPVSFLREGAGYLSAASAKTNRDGSASVTITSATSGFSTVQAKVVKGVSQIRDSKTVFFSAADVLRVSMSLKVNSVPGNTVYDEQEDLTLFGDPAPDDTVEILATVFDAGGEPVPGQSVQWHTDHVEEVVFSRVDIVTNEWGEAKAIIQVVPGSLRNTDTNVNYGLCGQWCREYAFSFTQTSEGREHHGFCESPNTRFGRHINNLR